MRLAGAEIDNIHSLRLQLRALGYYRKRERRLDAAQAVTHKLG
jgi:hypothetical protein